MHFFTLQPPQRISRCTQRTRAVSQLRLKNPALAGGQLQRMFINRLTDAAQQPFSCRRHPAANDDGLRIQQIDHIRQPITQQNSRLMHNLYCQRVFKIIGFRDHLSRYLSIVTV